MQTHQLPNRTTIATLVLTSLREVLAQNGQVIADDLNEEVSLIGRSAVLDSLGMVTLIVDLEQKIEEEYGVLLTLADDRAMSQKNSPFRTVQALTDYICTLIAEERQQ